MADAREPRTDGPQQSPLGVSIVWGPDGVIEPPLAAMHQRLYDRWKAANRRAMETKTDEDYQTYLDLDVELSRAITEAKRRHDQAMRETETHRAVVIQVELAKKLWDETKNMDDFERYLELKAQLAQAVMDEVYDEEGNFK